MPFFVPVLVVAGGIAARVAARQAARALAKRGGRSVSQRAAKRNALRALRNTSGNFGSVARTLTNLAKDPRIRRAVVRGLINARNRFPPKSGARQLCNVLIKAINPKITLRDFFSVAKYTHTSKRSGMFTDHFVRRGGLRQARREFAALTRGLKKKPGFPKGRRGQRTAILPNGTRITMYPKSSNLPQRPTIVVRPARGVKDRVTKVRYD
jgi:hypothetical protein